MGARRLDPKVIRVGDRVRIITPKFVKRVGYPKTVADYVPEVQEKFGAWLGSIFEVRKGAITGEIRYPTAFRQRIYDRVEHDLAYMLAKENGFGGRDRQLHFEELPEQAGREYYVAGLRTVYTGRYYPPSTSQSYYDGGYESDPGGLDNSKAHRLAELHLYAGRYINGRGWEIPTYFLEKIPAG